MQIFQFESDKFGGSSKWEIYTGMQILEKRILPHQVISGHLKATLSPVKFHQLIEIKMREEMVQT